MENKNKTLWFMAVIGGAVFIVCLIMGLSLIRELKTVSAILESGVVGNSVYQESPDPSILADSSTEFAGEDTISVKEKTVGCKISVTPVEFAQDTEAKVKVKNTGKTYSLKRKANSFAGSVPVSLFNETEMELILEDGQAVRTEALDIQEAYIPLSVSWIASGSEPQIRDGKADIDFTVEQNAEEGAVSDIQIAGISDGKQVYRKTLEPSGYTDENLNDVVTYHWEGKVPCSDGEKVEIYVLAKGRAGFTYRFKLGWIGKSWNVPATDSVEVLDTDGRVLMKTNPFKGSEESNEI